MIMERRGNYGSILRAGIVCVALNLAFACKGQDATNRQSAIAGPKAAFRIMNPYANAKKHAYRAALHVHSQIHTNYTHCIIPPPERLAMYRDCDVQPRYGVLTITDHNHITLPCTTQPAGAEPQWGVEGILFVPGNEKNIGHKDGRWGNFLGELNCVGVSTEAKDRQGDYAWMQDRFKYRHNPHWNELSPRDTLTLLVKEGVFVGLCHPNFGLQKQWKGSGYTYDELDMIFGNAAKSIPPFPHRPHALEIGNAGCDLSDRTNYKNAEEKWDYILSQGHRLWGTASDDAHNTGPFTGWIVVFLDNLTQADYMQSLHSGNFYASQGPQITSIEMRENTIRLATDEPSRIEFIGKGGAILHAEDGVKNGSYTANGTEMYVRARVTREGPWRKIEGGIGRRRSAWTNPFFIVTSSNQPTSSGADAR